jgi:hypothetical protein
MERDLITRFCLKYGESLDFVGKSDSISTGYRQWALVEQ